MKICIDFGGVCCIKNNNYEDDKSNYEEDKTNKSDDKTNIVDNKTDTDNTINMPHCLEALQQLSKDHELYLVSFCGARRANSTRQYLTTTYPGLFKHLYFVKNSSYKNDICRHVGADVMIDDRLDVLNDIDPEVCCLHFVGDPNFSDKIDDRYTMMSDWKEVVKCINTLQPKNRKEQPLDAKKMKKVCYM